MQNSQLNTNFRTRFMFLGTSTLPILLSSWQENTQKIEIDVNFTHYHMKLEADWSLRHRIYIKGSLTPKNMSGAEYFKATEHTSKSRIYMKLNMDFYITFLSVIRVRKIYIVCDFFKA